jgi:hypothetical protein
MVILFKIFVLTGAFLQKSRLFFLGILFHHLFPTGRKPEFHSPEVSTISGAGIAYES